MLQQTEVAGRVVKAKLFCRSIMANLATSALICLLTFRYCGDMGLMKIFATRAATSK